MLKNSRSQVREDPLPGKELVLRITAADQVGRQVEDLFFGHPVEQASWHWRRFRHDQTVDRLAVNGDLFIRFGQVRVQHQ